MENEVVFSKSLALIKLPAIVTKTSKTYEVSVAVIKDAGHGKTRE